MVVCGLSTSCLGFYKLGLKECGCLQLDSGPGVLGLGFLDVSLKRDVARVPSIGVGMLRASGPKCSFAYTSTTLCPDSNFFPKRGFASEIESSRNKYGFSQPRRYTTLPQGSLLGINTQE